MTDCISIPGPERVNKTKMIYYAETPLLKIAYLKQGEDHKSAVLLLHGWPDDATTWSGVIPKLTDGGYLVIAPWLRGFGNTRFKAENTPRTGNFGIIAYDMIALMDSLNIEQFSVIGHDWGSKIAESLAVGWPGRVLKMALLSSPPRLGGTPMPTFKHAQLEWYHWFMATKVGEKAVRKDPLEFTHIMWENWAPKGWYSEKVFQETSESWKNPDFIDVTLHSYRSRWGEAEPDDYSKELEEKIKATKTLSLPVLYVQGEADGVNPPYASAHVHEKFTGPFNRILMPGVGHFPSREAPSELSRHLVDFLNI